MSFDSQGNIDQNQSFKNFLLTNNVKSKRSIEYGKVIAQYIENQISGTQSYYFLRNNRFTINRKWASGKIDIQAMFQDRLEMNSKPNFINLSWKTPMIVNTIVSKLVGRWMTNNEKIVVTATDSLSINDKKEEYQQAEFILHNRELLEQLQQKSGVPMIGANQFVPEDENELDLWASEFQRLPEEILYEKGINDVMDANGYGTDGVMKYKTLHDSAEVGLVGTYTWMDTDGVIHIEWVKPENAIYSYSEYPDFRDTTYRGRVVSIKISEIRKKYGKEFGGKLSEEEIFKIASLSKEYQLNDKITWLVEWNVSFMRPYDEWNVDCIEFELKTLDVDQYTFVQTKKNKSTIVKYSKPNKLGDNEEYVEESKWNIYRGVYCRPTSQMLEWGLKVNMIRPNDPKELGNAEFSYSFYMPQMRDMRNLAVPEKIEEPVEGMILSRLKIQQLVMKMKPVGSAVNVDSLQELDLGLASGISKPIEIQKIYEQTGTLYYRGRDAEGNPIPVPITELQNSGFINQMQALISLYQTNYQILKDELGEDPNAIMAGTKPRVAAANVQAATEDAENATGHFYDAYLYLMEETAKKVSCLLNSSVTFGAEAYRHIIKQQDIAGRVFNTVAEMLPTQQEIQQLEGMMNEAIQSNPDLILFLDPFKVLRIAKKDVKLAELYFRQSMKKMLKSKIQQNQDNIQQQGQQNIQAAQVKAQSDQQLQEFDLQKTQISSNAQAKNTILQGFMNMYVANVPIPPEMKQIEQLMIQNIAIPAMLENQQNQNQLQQMLQQQQAQQQQAQQQSQQGNNQQQGQPQDEGQEQQQQPQEQNQEQPAMA